MKKLKEFMYRIQLAWLLIKANHHFVVTDSGFGTDTKNIDLTNSQYMCIENEDGGFDICYMIPWSMGKKCFTFTVAKFKGANAGQMCDAALELLNDHKVTGMVLGDAKNQPCPTYYVPLTIPSNNNKEEKEDEEIYS